MAARFRGRSMTVRGWTHGPVICAAAVLATVAGCGRSAPEPGSPVEIVAEFGGVGKSPGRFIYPRGIDSDESSIWVVDKLARIQKLDAKTGQCQAVWQMPDSEMGKPTGVTVAPGPGGEQLIYIPDTHYHRVLVYRPPSADGDLEAQPELVASFGSFGEEPGQFIYPTDIAVLPGDPWPAAARIYVSEYGGNDRISVFDGEYNFLFAFGQFGSGDREPVQGEIHFNRPQSIAIDGDELIVADSCNHRIGRFTLDGELIAWFGSLGEQLGQFQYPYGLCPLDDGTLLVAEFGSSRIQHVDLGARRGIGSYGAPGYDGGYLAYPWGVTVIGSMGFIIDSGNNRVLSFAAPARRAR